MISSILCTKYRTLVPVAETAKTRLFFSQLFPFSKTNSKIHGLLKIYIIQLWIICVVSLNISKSKFSISFIAFPF